MFAVVRSSGFDTVCSEFSHAFSDRDLGRSVTEMSCVSQNIDFSDVLERRTHAQCDRDWALRKHLEREMAFFGTLIETTENASSSEPASLNTMTYEEPHKSDH